MLPTKQRLPRPNSTLRSPMASMKPKLVKQPLGQRAKPRSQPKQAASSGSEFGLGRISVITQAEKQGYG